MTMTMTLDSNTLNQLMNYSYYWNRGYTDYSNGRPEGYSVAGETTTTEEKDAYLDGWYEAKEKRSGK